MILLLNDRGKFVNTRPTYTGFLLRSLHAEHVVYVSLNSYPKKQEFSHKSNIATNKPIFSQLSSIVFFFLFISKFVNTQRSSKRITD